MQFRSDAIEMSDAASLTEEEDSLPSLTQPRRACTAAASAAHTQNCKEFREACRSSHWALPNLHRFRRVNPCRQTASDSAATADTFYGEAARLLAGSSSRTALLAVMAY